MPFNLLDETLPFIIVLSSLAGPLLSPDDYKIWEQIFFCEKTIWHEVFTLFDHFKLSLVNQLYLLLHAVLITLTDDSYNEIHEDNVSYNQNDEPQEPCQDFEVLSALNYWWSVVVTNGLAQYNHEICSYFDSFVSLSRFLDYDLGHDGETSDHKKEIEEKDKKLLENNDQHSYQETDLSPDSYQKAEFDEAEDHN